MSHPEEPRPGESATKESHGESHVDSRHDASHVDEPLPALARPFRFADSPRHVTTLYRGIVGACVLLVGADFVIHTHPHFAAEKIPGFYGFYGGLMCAALVIAAKGLRRIVKRSEDYYGADDAE